MRQANYVAKSLARVVALEATRWLERVQRPCISRGTKPKGLLFLTIVTGIQRRNGCREVRAKGRITKRRRGFANFKKALSYIRSIGGDFLIVRHAGEGDLYQ
jgi:hypothetical protein